MFKNLIAGAACAGVLAGCATSPDKVSANYVPPAMYSSYSCDRVKDELLRVQSEVSKVTGQQQRKANNDKLAVGVGVVLFWPALFFLAAGDKKEELANLKGQYDALTVVANEKRCSFASDLRPRQS